MNRSRSHPTAAAILQEASHWLVRRDAGLDADEQAEFDAWLRVDSRHSRAMEEVQATWSAIERPRHTGEVDFALRSLERRRRRRVRRRFLAAGMSVAAAAVIAMVFRPASPRPSSDLAEQIAATMIVRPERQVLADGSVIELNAGTEMAIDFSANYRRVRLVSGAAHFMVEKDASRPFLVEAGIVEVRAIGTAFAVQLGAEEVEVLVTEGRVQVNRAAHESADVAPPAMAHSPDVGAGSLVSVGQRTIVPIAGDAPGSVTATLVEAVSAAEIERALAWRTRRVEFSGTPFAKALELFNRQNRIQLLLGDPALAKRQIGGIFWIDDPEGFARLLEASFDVQAIREQQDKIVFHSPKR